MTPIAEPAPTPATLSPEEEAKQAYSEGFHSVDPLMQPDRESEAPPTESEPATPPEPSPTATETTGTPETPAPRPAETPPDPAPPAPTPPPALTMEGLQEDIRRQGVIIEEMHVKNQTRFKRLDGTVGGQKSVLQAVNQKLKQVSGPRVEITETDLPELMQEFPEFGRSVVAGMNRVEARRFGTTAEPAAPPQEPAAPAVTAPPMPPTDVPPDPHGVPNQASPPITDPMSAPLPETDLVQAQAQARYDMELVYPGWQNIVYTDGFQQWLNAHGANYAYTIRDSKDPFRLKAEIERFTQARQTAPPAEPPSDTPPVDPAALAEQRFGGQVLPSTTPGRVPLPTQQTLKQSFSEGFNEVARARGEA